MTQRQLAQLVRRMRAAQRDHDRICRVFWSSHDATITRELEAAVDDAVAEALSDGAVNGGDSEAADAQREET